MNRKFKVWCPTYKQFNTMTDFFIHQNGELWVMPLDNKVQKANKNLIIVYSTGQPDKNGVEIYDGDIDEYKYVVEWVGGSAGSPTGEDLGMNVGWYFQRDNFESWHELEIKIDDKPKIIGNKFENPELMVSK